MYDARQRWPLLHVSNTWLDSAEQHQFLRDHPEKYLEYRKQIENELNQRFKFIIKGSDEANKAREYAYGEMYRRLRGDPHLVENIIPKNFNPGCRRPTPAPGYLEALIAENSTVYTDQIGSITPTGFTDHEGNAHEVDTIICATGFDTSWVPSFPFIADGKDLRDQWTQNNIVSYICIAVPEFPNHFMFGGPYGPLGHGSFMPLIEKTTEYIFQVIKKVQLENIKSIRPSRAASEEFRQHADLFLKRTAWTSGCKSWFKQGRTDGQAAIYPGSRLHFLELIETPRYEHFEFEYWDKCRWAFMGNGFDTREFDGRDITNYLGLMNDEDIQPDYDEGLINILAGHTLS